MFLRRGEKLTKLFLFVEEMDMECIENYELLNK